MSDAEHLGAAEGIGHETSDASLAPNWGRRDLRVLLKVSVKTPGGRRPEEAS